MSSVGNDLVQLLQDAYDGSLHAVIAAVEAGANVNGSPDQALPPLIAATIADLLHVVDFLLEQGADPNRPVTMELPCPGCSSLSGKTTPGERALHIAARSGKIEIVRVLLKYRSRADPNATDSRGCTPLMATCESDHIYAEVVSLLLEAGADPGLADRDSFVPLHLVARKGNTDLAGMLHAKAPAVLNLCASNGMTPLFVACSEGPANMVSKLLSLGAKQQFPLNSSRMCPLMKAAERGAVGVVRVLINEGGIRAVGGILAIGQALNVAVKARQAKVLRVLLTVNGEEVRSAWANVDVGGRKLLHYGAGYCSPAAVSILLEAGGKEYARDSEARVPQDVIGIDAGRDNLYKVPINRGNSVAIRRMLQRGPAYRARSWAWPSSGEARAGRSGGGGGTAAAAAVIGVQIYRPKEESRSNLFVRLVERYCAKD